MRVKIYAAGYCSFDYIEDDGFMDLPDGATLNDVFAKLGIPRLFRRLPFAAVNYVQAKPGTELVDGDVVTLIGAVSGG
jgi:molybdopterin converting factor small subunit